MAVELGSTHEDGAITELPLIPLTWRALILSIGFCVIASYWIEWSEVVTFFCQITESVPPIPAVAVIVLLVLVNPFLRRIWSRLSLRRGEILLTSHGIHKGTFQQKAAARGEQGPANLASEAKTINRS